MTDPDTTRHDNVFDLDDELMAIELRGMSRYGIEDGTLDEPTDKAITRWRKTMYRSARVERPDLPEDATDQEMFDAVMGRDWESASALEVDAFAILCGATPPNRARPTAPAAPSAPRIPDDATDDDKATAAAEHEKALAEHKKRLAAHEKDAAKYLTEWSGGWPTREQLGNLPFRPRAKLFGYLHGAFMNPTGAAGNSATSS